MSGPQLSDINCLQGIPPVYDLTGPKLYARLPLYCLALSRNNEYCNLLVTDLSFQEFTLFDSSQWQQSSFSMEVDSQMIQEEPLYMSAFPLKSSGTLSSTEVFVLLFKGNSSMENMCQKLGLDPALADGKDSVLLHDKCIFIEVEFRVKVHRKEFTLGLCRDRDAIKCVNDVEGLKQARGIKGLMKRVVDSFSDTYKAAIPKELLELGTPKRRYEGLGQMAFFNSSRGPSGSELLFQQHKGDENTQFMTQTQFTQRSTQSQDKSQEKSTSDQENVTPEQDRIKSFETDDNSQPRKKQRHQLSDAQGSRNLDSDATSKDSSNRDSSNRDSSNRDSSNRDSSNGKSQKLSIQDSQLPNGSAENISKSQVYDTSSQFDSFLVNRIDLKNLNQIPDTVEEINKKTIYKLEGTLRVGIVPNYFVIKPYNRTLKLTNLKFYFIESETETILDLEILTEEDFCNFLQLNEVEDMIDKMSSKFKEIEEICASETKMSVNVTKKIDHGRFSRSYWTVVDTLEALREKCQVT